MLTELQRARVAAGLSQAQAAQIIGKSQSVYSKIERGRVKLTAADAKALCDKFALSLADLVTT